jgi:hypothetical protein
MDELGICTALHATMLLDDAFGRWLQNLDGRQDWPVILDTCHSGGQASNEKGLAGPAIRQAQILDVMDGEANGVEGRRAKGCGDVGVVHAPLELSFIRKARRSLRDDLLDSCRTRQCEGPPR